MKKKTTKKEPKLPKGYTVVPEGVGMVIFHPGGRIESVVPKMPDDHRVKQGDPVWCVMLVSLLFTRAELHPLFVELVDKADEVIDKELSKEGKDEQLPEPVGRDRTPPGEILH